jgi:hypothetical protein
MDILLHHTKRVILVLLGVVALAGGPAALAAHAEGNGSGSGSGSSSYDCAGGKKWFDERVGDYNKLKDSHPNAAADALKDAKAEKERAGKEGCNTSGWALPLTTGQSGYVPPSTGTGEVLTGGGAAPGPVTVGGVVRKP